MSKKTIISSILLPNMPNFAAAFFRVGSIPLNSDGEECVTPEGQPAFPRVEKIEHCRDRFGGGAFVDQPCYTITFTEAAEKVIIPVTKFCQATVIVIDAEENHVPVMPQ